MTLYFQINNFRIPLREYSFEYPLLFKIYFEDEWCFDGRGKKKNLGFRTPDNILDIRVYDNSKHVVGITVTNSDQISFHHKNFDESYLLSNKSCASISINEPMEPWEKNIGPFRYSPRLHIYNNLMLILISDLCPRYLIYEAFTNDQKELGVVTNNNFEICGFIIWNLSPDQINHIKSYIQDKSIYFHQTIQQNPFEVKCKINIMENKNYLIRKIDELKNANLLNLLYYAYDKKLIDDQFLVDYAIYQLEKNQTIKDPFMLELAGLLNQEINKAGTLLEAQVRNKDEVLYENGQYYNKIWFYLTLAADMCAEKIIE